MTNRPCQACREGELSPMRRLRRGGVLAGCPRCGHLQLLEWTVSPDLDEYASVDPETYRRAMEPERRASARAVLGRLCALGIRGDLLDVGCSFGWLLEEARGAGIRAYGLDPSESAVASARARGLDVRCGHFPSERWDRDGWGAITFMDVLEHLEDVDAVIEAVTRLLAPEGFLAVQVPASTGTVFAATRLLERASGGRIDGPLRRMLQMGFPYPHVHYFDLQSMTRLLERFALAVVDVAFRPIASPGSLGDRVAFQARPSVADRVASAGLGTALLAGRALGRHDLLQVIARKR